MKFFANFILISLLLIFCSIILLNDAGEEDKCITISDLLPSDNPLVKQEFTISGKAKYVHNQSSGYFDFFATEINTRKIYDLTASISCKSAVSGTNFISQEYLLNGNGEGWSVTLDTRNFNAEFKLAPTNFICSVEIYKFSYNGNSLNTWCNNFANEISFRYDTSK